MTTRRHPKQGFFGHSVSWGGGGGGGGGCMWERGIPYQPVIVMAFNKYWGRSPRSG